jgi:hypothetical protein
MRQPRSHPVWRQLCRRAHSPRACHSGASIHATGPVRLDIVLIPPKFRRVVHDHGRSCHQLSKRAEPTFRTEGIPAVSQVPLVHSLVLRVSHVMRYGLTVSQLMLVTPSTAKSNGSTPSPRPARCKNGMMNDPRQQSTCNPILYRFAIFASSGIGSWTQMSDAHLITHDSAIRKVGCRANKHDRVGITSDVESALCSSVRMHTLPCA